VATTPAVAAAPPAPPAALRPSTGSGPVTTAGPGAAAAGASTGVSQGPTEQRQGSGGVQQVSIPAGRQVSTAVADGPRVVVQPRAGAPPAAVTTVAGTGSAKTPPQQLRQPVVTAAGTKARPAASVTPQALAGRPPTTTAVGGPTVTVTGRIPHVLPGQPQPQQAAAAPARNPPVTTAAGVRMPQGQAGQQQQQQALQTLGRIVAQPPPVPQMGVTGGGRVMHPAVAVHGSTAPAPQPAAVPAVPASMGMQYQVRMPHVQQFPVQQAPADAHVAAAAPAAVPVPSSTVTNSASAAGAGAAAAGGQQQPSAGSPTAGGAAAAAAAVAGAAGRRINWAAKLSSSAAARAAELQKARQQGGQQ
jgi:S-DNA-T family DNA segregation ATPase FtsK/SpoIIIE